VRVCACACACPASNLARPGTRCTLAQFNASAAAQVRAQIIAGLSADTIWDRSAGMYRASSGNNAAAIDVFGSAMVATLALADLPARAATITAYLSTNFGSFTQNGLIRLLPAVRVPGSGKPSGQYWADTRGRGPGTIIQPDVPATST
jgi:hypothetical protein